jgi:hypothetical protein
MLHILYKIAVPSFLNPMDSRLGVVSGEGQARAIQILTALQHRNGGLGNPFARLSTELSLAVCHQNPLQEHFGEKLFSLTGSAWCVVRVR